MLWYVAVTNIHTSNLHSLAAIYCSQSSLTPIRGDWIRIFFNHFISARYFHKATEEVSCATNTYLFISSPSFILSCDLRSDLHFRNIYENMDEQLESFWDEHLFQDDEDEEKEDEEAACGDSAPYTASSPSHTFKVICDIDDSNNDILNIDQVISGNQKNTFEVSPGTVVEFPTEIVPQSAIKIDDMRSMEDPVDAEKEEPEKGHAEDDSVLATFGEMFFDIFKSQSEDDEDEDPHDKNQNTTMDDDVAINDDVQKVESGKDNLNDWYSNPPSQEQVEKELSKLNQSRSSSKDIASNTLCMLQSWFLHSTDDGLATQELIAMDVVPTLLTFVRDNTDDHDGVSKSVKFIYQCICEYCEDYDDKLAIQFVQSRGIEVFVSALAAHQSDYFPHQPCLFKTIFEALIGIVDMYPCVIALLQCDPVLVDEKLQLLQVVEIVFERVGHVMTTEYMKSLVGILNSLIRTPVVIVGHTTVLSNNITSKIWNSLGQPPSTNTDRYSHYQPAIAIRREILRKHLAQKCKQILETNDYLCQDADVMERIIIFFSRVISDECDGLSKSLGHDEVLPLIGRTMHTFRQNSIIQGTGCLMKRNLLLEYDNQEKDGFIRKKTQWNDDANSYFDEFLALMTVPCCSK